MVEETNQSSRPVQNREVTFRSVNAARVYRRNFTVAQAHMYSMLIMNRVYKRNMLAEQASEAINKFFAEVESEISAEIERCEQLCKEFGANPEEMEYSDPTKKTVEITLPQGARLINLILKLDDLMVIIDCLWWNGVMDDKGKITQARLWEENVAKVTSRIRNMYAHFRKALQLSNNDQLLNEHFRPLKINQNMEKEIIEETVPKIDDAKDPLKTATG